MSSTLRQIAATRLVMHQPDFEAARQYALDRLQRELSLLVTYHSLAHTVDEVAPAADHLAALEGVTGEDLLLLRTAALYHDVGFVEQHHDHEAGSARIAAAVLPGFGYAPAQIQAIVGMILATQLPQTPHTLLEQIMADADLDILGHVELSAPQCGPARRVSRFWLDDDRHTVVRRPTEIHSRSPLFHGVSAPAMRCTKADQRCSDGRPVSPESVNKFNRSEEVAPCPQTLPRPGSPFSAAASVR